MASYTYTSANTDTDSTVPDYYQVFDLPRHKVSLVATKQWNQRLATTFDLHYYSSYLEPYVGWTCLSVSWLYAANSRQLSVVTARTSDGEHLLQDGNIFNPTYYQSGYRAAGATALAGLRYSF